MFNYLKVLSKTNVTEEGSNYAYFAFACNYESFGLFTGPVCSKELDNSLQTRLLLLLRFK